MKNLFSIGEVSKLTKIPIKALRLYDSMDLLKPHYVDDQTRYRFYSYNQFFKIDLIRYMNKVLLIPLEEIKTMLNAKDNNEALIECLKNHEQAIDAKMQEIEHSKQTIQDMLKKLGNKKKAHKSTNQIYEQYLMKRYLITTPVQASISNIDLYTKRHIAHYFEKPVSTSEMFESGEDTSMCYLFDKGDYDPESSDLIISHIGSFSSRKQKNRQYLVLPEGRYLCCRFQYSEEAALTVVRQLIDYAHKQQIHLDHTALLLFDRVDLSVGDKYDYEMELQIFEVGI